MRTRTVKKCEECNYELKETVQLLPKNTIVGKCPCPQCGLEAAHYMYVDYHNMPEPKKKNVPTGGKL